MRLKFRIHVPGTTDQVITGSFEDAIEAFEEALWEAQLLPDEESLSATDHLGLAGGVYPEDVLGLQGFLTFAPDTYVEVIREERGPGRPEIGPAIQVRLPEDLLAQIDARAEAKRVTRAEMIRELLAKALDQQATAKARLRWEHTVYCDGRGGEYPAILIRWQDVKTFLGELHNGDPEQDERLVDGLLAAGAPDWVREAPGWVDENGWGLYSMGEEA